jgi:hypothetical protein
MEKKRQKVDGMTWEGKKSLRAWHLGIPNFLVAYRKGSSFFNSIRIKPSSLIATATACGLAFPLPRHGPVGPYRTFARGVQLDQLGKAGGRLRLRPLLWTTVVHQDQDHHQPPVRPALLLYDPIRSAVLGIEGSDLFSY